MNLSKSCAYVAMLMFLVVEAAAADDSGLYVSAALGNADHADEVVLHPPEVAAMTGTSEGHDDAWALTAGYKFNRNIAVEITHFDLGDMEASVSDRSGGSNAQADFTFSMAGTAVSLVGTFPIGRWEPYVKAGVFFSESELAYSGSVSGTSFTARIKDDSEDALFGAGVGYKLSERWRAHLDITYFMEAGEPSGGQADYLSVLVGVSWRF
jgi:outer membrane protein W